MSKSKQAAHLAALAPAPKGWRYAAMNVDAEGNPTPFKAMDRKVVRAETDDFIVILVPTTDDAALAFGESQKARKFYDPIAGEWYSVEGLASLAAARAKFEAESRRGALRNDAVKLPEGKITDAGAIQRTMLGAPVISEETINEMSEEELRAFALALARRR